MSSFAAVQSKQRERCLSPTRTTTSDHIVRADRDSTPTVGSYTFACYRWRRHVVLADANGRFFGRD